MEGGIGGGMEGGMEGGRDGGRDRGRDGGRDGGREGTRRVGKKWEGEGSERGREIGAGNKSSRELVITVLYDIHNTFISKLHV